MAVSEQVEQIDGDEDLKAVVREVVAEETAELREELEEERNQRQALEKELEDTQAELAEVKEKRLSTSEYEFSAGDFTFIINYIAGKLTGSAGEIDFTQSPMANKEYFDKFADRIDEIGSSVQRHDSIIEEHGQPSGDSKSSAWQDTIDAAENLQTSQDHGLPNNRVKLFTENIEQATGYTNRRASQLIDEWGDEKEGTEKQEYKRITSSRKTETSGIQKKALIVDLDVWGSDNQ